MLRIFFITCIISILSNVLVSQQAHAYFFFQEDPETTESDNPPNNTNVSIQRSEIDIAKPISVFEQQKQDLSHYLPKEKKQNLQAGDSEYIIVEQTHSTQNSKGVAILIPDWQTDFTTPKGINFLRKTLPEHGWSTISVQAPSKPNNYPSMALKSEQFIDENKAALMPYQNELKSLITAVMEKAKNYPGIFLVITEGSQAAMLINLYKNNTNLAPTAFVILSAGMYTDLENDSFAKNIAQTNIPVLDLILKKDSNKVLENAKLRKKYALKEMKVVYRQKALTNIYPGYYPEQTLLTEINGWLKSIGW